MGCPIRTTQLPTQHAPSWSNPPTTIFLLAVIKLCIVLDCAICRMFGGSPRVYLTRDPWRRETTRCACTITNDLLAIVVSPPPSRMVDAHWLLALCSVRDARPRCSAMGLAFLRKLASLSYDERQQRNDVELLFAVQMSPCLTVCLRCAEMVVSSKRKAAPVVSTKAIVEVRVAHSGDPELSCGRTMTNPSIRRLIETVPWEQKYSKPLEDTSRSNS
jgi:hypothetical protein